MIRGRRLILSTQVKWISKRKGIENSAYGSRQFCMRLSDAIVKLYGVIPLRSLRWYEVVDALYPKES